MGDDKKRSEPSEIIFQSLPQLIRESLTEEQTEALRAVLVEKPWRDHALDVRISVPMPYKPFYLTLIGDPEKRSPERRMLERLKHPFLKRGNILFIIGAALFFVGVGIVSTLLYSSIVE